MIAVGSAAKVSNAAVIGIISTNKSNVHNLVLLVNLLNTLPG